MDLESTSIFACPTYHGGRFDQHSLPVDVLPDLAGYRDLVVAVAKHLYLSAAAGRRRVPKGFADSLQLGLAGVVEGSAGAVIKRLAVAGAMVSSLFAQNDDFTHARDLVGRVVEAAASGADLPKDFPSDLLPKFNRIGRSLGPGEYIEFRAQPGTVGAKYSRDTRRKLILGAAEQYEDEAIISGAINGAVVDRNLVVVRSTEGLIDLPVSPELARQALLWIDRTVRVPALVLRNRDDSLMKVVEVHDLTFVEYEAATPLPTQFEDLEKLQEGWLDGEGNKPDSTGLRAFRDMLVDAVDTQALPVPFTYPTPEGNVRAEWSFPGWEVNAVASLVSRVIDLHAIDVVGDDTANGQIRFDKREASSRLARWVAQYMPQETSS